MLINNIVANNLGWHMQHAETHLWTSFFATDAGPWHMRQEMSLKEHGLWRRM